MYSFSSLRLSSLFYGRLAQQSWAEAMVIRGWPLLDLYVNGNDAFVRSVAQMKWIVYTEPAWPACC